VVDIHRLLLDVVEHQYRWTGLTDETAIAECEAEGIALWRGVHALDYEAATEFNFKLQAYIEELGMPYLFG
jgi:hypothetical protein